MKNIFRKDNTRFDFRFNLKSLSENIDKIGEKVDSAEKFTGEVYFLRVVDLNILWIAIKI